MKISERIEAVKGLCSFEGRVAGSDAERRAANDLARQLRDFGRRAEVEPIYVHPQWPTVHAFHCVLALAGSLVALNWPPVGFGILLVTAASMYLDLNGRFYLLRRLFFRRASQNVVSRGRSRDADVRLILSARFDAGRTGAAYGRAWGRANARIAKLVPAPFSPARLVFWSIAFLIPLVGLRMAGVEDTVVSALQLPPTLVVVLATFLLVDIQLSPPSPAANSNASGVATVLSLAAELEDEPPENLDVWIVFAGAGDQVETGMRSFVRDQRDELDREATWFVDVEGVGKGDVRYLVSQGPVVSFGMASRLTELCAAIADADAEREEGSQARPLASGYAHGSLPAVVRRYPATTITCLAGDDPVPQRANTTDDVADELDPHAMERAHRFALELVRALDRDLARRAERGDREPAGP